MFKSNKCKICRHPSRPFKTTCSIDCEAELAIKLLDKKKRAEAKNIRAADKEHKEKQKTKSEHASDAQREVNKYVKFRDWGNPCISCGTTHKFDVARDASHFKSRGSSSFLRFNLWNLHMACVQCNMKKGGNIIEYYPRLVKKIGQEKVDYLMNAPKSREYSIEYLNRLKRIFAKKAKRQEKRINS